MEIVVQINGKVKEKLIVDANSDKEALEKMAMESEKIKGLLEGKSVVKIIAVPKRLINIVVK